MWNNYAQIYGAYRSSWLARQIVNIPAQDMTRNWRTFKCEGAEDIQRAEKALRARKKFGQLLSLARMSGGAIGVMIIDGQPLDEPLDLNRIKKGSFKNMQIFDRFELSVSRENITNPLLDNFMMPRYYTVTGSGAEIHHSNCVTMLGEELPRLLSRTQNGWGDSVLRKCMEDLTDVVASRGGVAALLQKANVDIIKTDGLKSAVTSGMEQQITQRLSLFKMGMSNHNLGILDVAEDLIRMGINFGGLSETLNALMCWVAGAADIPMTRLFNEQSKGFGDSGDGNMRNYHDSLSATQEDKLRPALECFDEVLVRSALGAMPEDCDFIFNPLFQPSGVELAQERLAQAQADMLDLDAEVATVSQIQRRRMADDVYQYDPDNIDKLEDYEQEKFDVLIGNGYEEEQDLFAEANGAESRTDPEEEKEKVAEEKSEEE